jgi:hypothetical protein
LTSELYVWAKRNGTGMGFDLPDGSNRSPDASWKLKSRIESLRREQCEE